jgi:hypothetical protein
MSNPKWRDVTVVGICLTAVILAVVTWIMFVIGVVTLGRTR